jgi:hypothetical protein
VCKNVSDIVMKYNYSLLALATYLCHTHRYRKAKNRLLKFCYVPTTSAAQSRLLFYFFAAAVYSTTEANKASLKQSIILRCLWSHLPSWPRQVQSCVAVAGIIPLTFTNVNTAFAMTSYFCLLSLHQSG